MNSGHVIRFFSNINNYDTAYRYTVNMPAKVHWGDRPILERQQIYGKWVELYKYEPEIEETDICILTYNWNYYVEHEKIVQAKAEVIAARAQKKPFVIFNDGDWPANIPFENVILFETSGYRSSPGLRYHSAQPSYITDYLQTYCEGNLQLRTKRAVPVIGFCGQASTSPIQTAFRKMRLKWRQRQYRRGRLKWEPPPFETSSFRTRVLKQFVDKPGIQTNYILRRKYRAGETKDKSLYNPTKVAFIDNILNSDYTVCMRGGGNFSVRFYETLCLGRIPIFIDSDCLLPFQDKIDYKALFPWIELHELPYAADILSEFHARLSTEDFIGIQKACRQLWLEHMIPDSFHQDFVQKMSSFLP